MRDTLLNAIERYTTINPTLNRFIGKEVSMCIYNLDANFGNDHYYIHH